MAESGKLRGIALLLLLGCFQLNGAEAKSDIDTAYEWTEDSEERLARLRRISPGRFTNISDRVGFSSRYIYDFAQDEQGFIWIGTRNGLDRFDGYSVTNFRHDPGSRDSLSSNDIRTLVAAPNGVIWTGSHSAGLDRFDSATGIAKNFRDRPGDPTDIGDDHIVNVSLDNNGNIWVATRTAGLARIDKNTLAVTRFHSKSSETFRIPSDYIETIFIDADGGIWAGTHAGLIFAESPDVAFRTIDVQSGIAPEAAIVYAIFQRADGVVFAFTTGGGLFRINASGTELSVERDASFAITLLERSEANDSVMDRYGRLWIATNFANMQIYDTYLDRSVVIPFGPRALFEDHSGSVWLGSDDGLFRLNPDDLKFGDLAEELRTLAGASLEQILAIYETPDNTVWLADPNGVWRHEIGTDSVEWVTVDGSAGPEANDTNALHQDQQGFIWSGTHFAGINRIDPESGQVRNYSLCADDSKTALCNRVWVIRSDETGMLWVGSANSLLFFDYVNNAFRTLTATDDLANSMIASGVRSLAIGSDNILWIGTESGLLRWRRDNDVWASFQHDPANPDSLSNNYINTLHVDVEGALWIGTQLGAHRLDPASRQIVHFNTSTGLPNDDVHSIVEDKNGTLWLSTGDGIVSIDQKSLEIRIFDENSGLSDNEFLLASGHAGASGRVYFGGTESVVYFDPDKLAINKDPPRVALTELRINNEAVTPDPSTPAAILHSPINMTQSVTVPYQLANLAVEFAALHFADPSQNKYAYRLVGYDNDWIYTDSAHRIASYTKIPFGEYTLRVKAANSDGVWNDLGTSLGITVLTPYWRTWWAYVLFVFACVASGGLLVRARTQSLADRARLLERTVTDRTQQIRNNEKLIQEQAVDLEQLLHTKERLFTNISHEFRTPLTLILGPVNKMLQSGLGDEHDSRLQLIKRNGQRLLRLVNQLLDISRMDAEAPLPRSPQHISKIVTALSESFAPLARHRDITFECDANESLWVSASTDAIEKILMNLLSNSFKYTPKGGNINIGLRASGHCQVSLAVSDSGIGIPMDQHEQIFCRFVRGNGSDERIPGAGIGLALVKELVDALDGRIELRSTPGEGTTIIVTLDRCKVPASPPEISTTVDLSEHSALELESLSQIDYVSVRTANDDEHNNPSVLIIEDNPDMQQYLVELLSPTYSCLTADDGEVGLQTGLDQVPDVVICDVMLPKMDGYGVSQKLKVDERTSHIPIIMLTARGDHESRIQGLREKVDDYLSKPFDDEELLLRIRNILDARAKFRDRFALQTSVTDEVLTGLGEKDKTFLTRLNGIIEKNLSESSFRIDELAAELAMSDRGLQRKLKAIIGHTPSHYLRCFRLKKSLEFLRDGLPVYLAAESVGFTSPAYFSNCFKDEFGFPPSEYVDETNLPSLTR